MVMEVWGRPFRWLYPISALLHIVSSSFFLSVKSKKVDKLAVTHRRSNLAKLPAILLLCGGSGVSGGSARRGLAINAIQSRLAVPKPLPVRVVLAVLGACCARPYFSCCRGAATSAAVVGA